MTLGRNGCFRIIFLCASKAIYNSTTGIRLKYIKAFLNRPDIFIAKFGSVWCRRAIFASEVSRSVKDMFAIEVKISTGGFACSGTYQCGYKGLSRFGRYFSHANLIAQIPSYVLIFENSCTYRQN